MDIKTRVGPRTREEKQGGSEKGVQYARAKSGATKRSIRFVINPRAVITIAHVSQGWRRKRRGGD